LRVALAFVLNLMRHRILAIRIQGIELKNSPPVSSIPTASASSISLALQTDWTRPIAVNTTCDCAVTNELGGITLGFYSVTF
jgi:hypothetical protein